MAKLKLGTRTLIRDAAKRRTALPTKGTAMRKAIAGELRSNKNTWKKRILGATYWNKDRNKRY